MKIEIGESLIYSWLRHVKKCQIVQTNWTVSPEWEKTKIEELESKINSLVDDLNQKAKEVNKDVDLDIFKKSNLKQSIKQAECDAMGMEIDNEGRIHIHAVDVAFHKDGLLYGRKKYDTVSILLKKYIRTAICVYLSLGEVNANIIFATPKSRKIVNELIPIFLGILKERLNEVLNVNYNFEFIADDDFKKDIFDKVIGVSDAVNDTNELFLRSYQLEKLFINKR